MIFDCLFVILFCAMQLQFKFTITMHRFVCVCVCDWALNFSLLIFCYWKHLIGAMCLISHVFLMKTIERFKHSIDYSIQTNCPITKSRENGYSLLMALNNQLQTFDHLMALLFPILNYFQLCNWIFASPVFVNCSVFGSLFERVSESLASEMNITMISVSSIIEKFHP